MNDLLFKVRSLEDGIKTLTIHCESILYLDLRMTTNAMDVYPKYITCLPVWKCPILSKTSCLC